MVAIVASQPLSTAPRRAIQTPDCEIQSARESNPAEVRHQKKGRIAIESVESRDGCGNRKPQQNYVQERQVRTAKAEEKRRPCRVDHQAAAINGERHDGACKTCLSPYQPAGYRDGQIQNAPCGSKRPSRGAPSWLPQTFVPLARPEHGSRGRRKKADADKASQSYNGRVVHRLQICTNNFAIDRRIPTNIFACSHKPRSEFCKNSTTGPRS